MLGKTKKFTILFIFFFILIIPVFVLAQKLEVNYPEIFGEKPETVQYGLPQYAKYIFNFAIAVIGLIAFASLVWGGILYLSSAGKPERLKEGKDRIFFALIGMIILFSAYVILVNINPQLLIFDFPPLTPLISSEIERPPMVITKGASLIVEEIPLGQMAKNGPWEQKKTQNFQNLIVDFENFLNQEVKINDPSLTNDVFTKISDLNKYLKRATDECRCQNLRSLSTKPETGSLPVGCTGDPCQTDQGNEVEPGSARDRINKIIAIDRVKIKELLNYQEKINAQKNLLREDLRKFQETEGELIACQNQKNELTTLNEYLANKQYFEKEGNKIVKKSGYLESKGDPLTFYCSIGGTIFDYSYDINAPEEEEARIEEEMTSEEFEQTTFEKTKTSCPFEIPLGEEVLDQLRELTIIAVFKLERISLLIGEMTKQIQKMTELVSQCNETGCQASSVCVPNPWYQCCSPIPCGPMFIFCRSRCLQAVGGCSGDACPTEKLQKKTEQIKETEDKILETIEEIKLIFPQVSFLLNEPKNPYNLENISTSVGLCYSSDIYNPTWELLNCEEARGDYGPSGQIMTNCHPRNLFCCTSSQQTLSLPIPVDTSPIYIIPAQKFSPLPSENNCPKGWLCNQEIKDYNQYNNDASEPLKELLSCMRQRLDRIQGGEKLEGILGQISAISDPNLYKGKCDWTAGPAEPGGCSHIYETKRGKERVSAHYGGSMCRYEKKSYAVDIDISADEQKKYADKILETAVECFPSAYILDKVDHIHIDIANVYHCRSNE